MEAIMNRVVNLENDFEVLSKNSIHRLASEAAREIRTTPLPEKRPWTRALSEELLCVAAENPAFTAQVEKLFHRPYKDGRNAIKLAADGREDVLQTARAFCQILVMVKQNAAAA